MYLSLREQSRETTGRPVGRPRLPVVGRNVLFLGLVSMFTDISSEMVAATLPLYLTVVLGFTPLQFGVVDGLYQGVTALVRLAGGVLADRWHRYREVAAAGYGLSALCKLALLAVAGSWAAFAGVIALDRIGKGIRTAPRDALISLSSAPERLAGAFGVHRALDTAGAMLGPLVAFALLALAPNAFDAVFVVSFCLAIVGLSILVLFVRQPPRRETGPAAPRISLGRAIGLLREPRFGVLVLVGGALSLCTVSDGFVYLVLQRRLDLAIGFFPLLFVGTSAVYLLLAVPAGRLADRLGRGRMFLAGHALLLGVYALLLRPVVGIVETLISVALLGAYYAATDGVLMAIGGVLLGVYALLLRPAVGIVETLISVALLGAYYAATDGVLMAIGGVLLPEHLRGSGLALLTTATAAGRFGASLLFGLLWSWAGQETATVAFALALAIVLIWAAVALRVREPVGTT